MTSQFKQSLSFKEIEDMRNQILTLLTNINTKKHRIQSHDHRQLNNHLQYALSTLSNMHNIQTVEQADPFKTNYAKASDENKKVVYNSDGTTRIIKSGQVHTTGDDWEKQFDESLLMRPPCFQLPPQNLTNLPRIRQASNHSYDMVRGL